MGWQVRLFDRARQLPKKVSGVYLLFVDGKIDYVGQSDNVRQRLMEQHHVYREDEHDRIALIEEPSYETRLALERYFNAKYNPPNSYSGTAKQSNEPPDWHLLSSSQRRALWNGPAFDEFKIRDDKEADPPYLELSQSQVSDNAMGVPGIIALKPKDVRKH